MLNFIKKNLLIILLIIVSNSHAVIISQYIFNNNISLFGDVHDIKDMALIDRQTINFLNLFKLDSQNNFFCLIEDPGYIYFPDKNVLNEKRDNFLLNFYDYLKILNISNLSLENIEIRRKSSIFLTVLNNGLVDKYKDIKIKDLLDEINEIVVNLKIESLEILREPFLREYSLNLKKLLNFLKENKIDIECRASDLNSISSSNYNNYLKILNLKLLIEKVYNPLFEANLLLKILSNKDKFRYTIVLSGHLHVYNLAKKLADLGFKLNLKASQPVEDYWNPELPSTVNFANIFANQSLGFCTIL